VESSAIAHAREREREREREPSFRCAKAGQLCSFEGSTFRNPATISMWRQSGDKESQKNPNTRLNMNVYVFPGVRSSYSREQYTRSSRLSSLLFFFVARRSPNWLQDSVEPVPERNRLPRFDRDTVNSRLASYCRYYRAFARSAEIERIREGAARL